LLDHQDTVNGFVSKVKGKIDVLDYFKKLTNERREWSEGTYGNWLSAYKHLQAYCGNRSYSLESIDDNFVEGFKNYLTKNISRRGEGKINPNSAVSYYNKLRSAMKE